LIRQRARPPRESVTKIVIVHPSDEMYGADRMVLQVIEAMRDELGLSVEVWLPDDVPHVQFPLCEELTARGVAWEHRSFPVLRRSYLRPLALVRLAGRWISSVRALRRARPAVIHLSTSTCLLVAVAARVAGVPHRVVHIQERWGEAEGRVLRTLARFTTGRIAISGSVAVASGLSKPPPTVIPNCVDDPGAPTASPQGDAITFLVASRWNSWKGHRTLLRAWELAGCPGRLIVLGGPPPIGRAVDVPQLVTELVSRPESVDVIGEVSDIAPYIVSADALVLPSDEPEPFGLVVIEAFARARPVIASRAGGPLEIIRDGHDGWLFPIGDAESLAGTLKSLDRARLRTAGLAARATYEASYEPSRFRRGFASELERLIGQ
jgi:glycosyltransferase involved in cell wall biosynthesis